MNRRAWLQATGYGVFTLCSLGLGAVMTFPAEAAGLRLAYELERASRGAWSLSFGQAESWRLSGLRLKDVKLRRQVPGEAAQLLPAQALGLRLQLLPLLWAKVSLVADMQAGAGRLVAVVSPGRHAQDSFALELHDWDIGRPPWLQSVVPLPVAGVLNGQGELAWQADARKSNGHLKLSAAGMHLGPGTVGGIGLPAIDMGEVSFVVELKDGRLRLQEFKQQGGNLSLQGKFGLQLKEPMAQSAWETCLMVRVDPAFLAANPKLRGALQIAEVQLKRDAEGFLHVPLAGSMAQPRLAGGLCR